MIRVCIDTNVLFQLFGRSVPGRAIREALLAGEIELAISNEILFEYQEAITRLAGAENWQKIERFLTLIFALHANVLFLEPQFRFHVVRDDPDDNKFVDCAIAAQADYIITHDHHLNALIDSGYKPRPISAEAFVRRSAVQ